MKVLTKDWIADVFAKSAQEEEVPLVSSPPQKKAFSLSREQLATWARQSAEEEELPLISPPAYKRVAPLLPQWLGEEVWGDLVALSQSQRQKGHTVSPEELAWKLLRSAVKQASHDKDNALLAGVFADTTP
jgi:hypothetical protein